MRRVVLLVGFLSGLALSQAPVNPATLPVLFNPMLETPKQQFTAAEKTSFQSLVKFLNGPRSAALEKALLNDGQYPYCPQANLYEAMLSFTAPFRNNQPEKLEVLAICGGERNSMVLSFTQNGKRTVYLLPPDRGGGGMWGFIGAFTVKDINLDERRELALIQASGSDVTSFLSLWIISFSPSGPELLGRFDDVKSTGLINDGITYSGETDLLRVQKGSIPVVYHQKFILQSNRKTWQATNKVWRTALISNPLNFMVWK